MKLAAILRMRVQSCVAIFVLVVFANPVVLFAQTIDAPGTNPFPGQNSAQSVPNNAVSPSDRIRPTSRMTLGQFQNQVQDLPPAPNPEKAGKIPDLIDQLEQAKKDLAKQPSIATPPQPQRQPAFELPKTPAETKSYIDQQYNQPFDNEGWVDVSDEKWQNEIHGRVLMDTIHWIDDTELGGVSDVFQFRQLRLAVDGRGYGVYSYRLELEFEPETPGGFFSPPAGTIDLKDAWIGVDDVPFAGFVRAGHFRVPFGFDQAAERRDLTFMERFIMDNPAGFVPAREAGIAHYRHNADQTASISKGIFYQGVSETTKEIQDDNQGFVASTRVTMLPYFDEPSDGRYLVHAGLGLLYVQPRNNAVAFSGRPSIHEGPTLALAGATASERYSIVNPEFAMNMGAVSFQGEYFWVSADQVIGPRIDMHAAYVSASYRLTGEHRKYNKKFACFGQLVPFENAWLLPGNFGMGAWEVAARYSWVDLNEAANSSQYDEVALALNWYLNPNTRFQVNYIHAITAGAPFLRTNSEILTMRLGVFF